MKFSKMLAVTLCVFILTLSTSFASNKAQTIIRLFSYDPHPNSAIFPNLIPFDGKLVKAQVVFNETWKANKNIYELSKIGFTLNFLSNNKVIRKAIIKPFELKSKIMQKGRLVCETFLGKNRLQVTFESEQKNKNRLTDITFKFKILYNNKGMENLLANSTKEGAKDFRLSLAQKFVFKANKLKSDSIPEKIDMLKRALKLAPKASASPAAAAFHSSVSKSIRELEQSK